jgi:GMP synthase (glutamine-hydrolysing)
MKRIHFFQHVPFEGSGIIGPWAEQRGFSLSTTRFFDGQQPPDLEGVDWLVIMGGPMGVYDEVQYPWLIEEKATIKQALSDGKVILGICLGAQLIAECMGARVRPNCFKEIGWFPTFLESHALDLPIAEVLPPQWDALHWHGDTFDIPSGARLLATSAACHNQGFIYEDRVVALQFHLEMGRRHLEDLVRHAAHELVPDQFVQTAEQVLAADAPFAQARLLMEQILGYLDQLPNALA